MKVDIIYNEDCLQGMKRLPDNSIDLVLTDPPYGVRQEKWDNKEHFISNISVWLDECLRVSSTVIWFCAGIMIPYILRGREDIFHRLLIWNKPIGTQYAGAMHSNIWYSMEPILVFGSPPKTNKNKRYGYSVLNTRTIAFKEYGHPTTKPLSLIRELIYFYSNKGDIVLDPFLGSGTTAVACKQLNRYYIGFEISKEYCEIAKKRLTNIQLELIK